MKGRNSRAPNDAWVVEASRNLNRDVSRSHGLRKIKVATVIQTSNQSSIGKRSDQPLGPRATDQAAWEDAFLMRNESLRARQEWPSTLDMRQYVSEPCKRYRYRRRLFWLDADSRKLFLESLKRENGIFTVASHTEILVEALAKEGQALVPSAASVRAAPASLVAKQGIRDTPIRQLNQVLRLGYYENRRDERIKYSTRVQLIGDGPIAWGHTRDISKTGIQVRTSTPLRVRAGDVIQVRFPDLAKIENGLAPYRVLHIAQQLKDFLVSLRFEEDRSGLTNTVLNGVLDQRRDNDDDHFGVDSEDAALTAESLFAERHYMCSSALIPFFLAREWPQGKQMTVAFYNEANQESLFAFKTENGGNALAEAINRRHLGHLMRLATTDGLAPALLAVWRSSDGGDLATLMDLSCRTDKQWYASLARHGRADDFRVFRVIVRRVRRPSRRRLARELEPLAAKSPADADQLLRDGERLVAVGGLVDVTAEIRTWNLTPYESVPTTKTCRDVEDSNCKIMSKPELLPIQYTERMRSHDRYLFRLHVTLEIQGKFIEAITTDVSLTGMSVLLPKDTLPVTLGGPVRVTFSGLVAKAALLDRLRKSLEAVPFQVVSADCGSKTLLRVRLVDPDRQKGFTRALSALLRKQRSMLEVDVSHSVQAATTRLYSAYFIEASAAIPMFFFPSKADSTPFAKVGLTRQPSHLAAFFEIADGRFDFSAITAPVCTSYLWNEMQQRGRGEVILYLIKERLPDQPRYRISAVADFDFADRAERGEFLRDAVGKDFRIVKIVMSPPRSPSPPDLAQIIKRLEQISAPRAARLREKYENLVAVGDLLDITTNFEEMRYIAP